MRWRRTGDPVGSAGQRGKPPTPGLGELRGWHQDDQGVWWYYDARQRYRGVENKCLWCGKLFPVKEVVAKEPGKGLYCSRDHANKAERPGRREARGGKGRYLNAEGYVRILVPDPESGKKVWRLEHRVVMEGIIERPLLPEETVHHGPKGKGINTRDNLELWSGKHPKGQRVRDLLEYAHEIIDLYGHLEETLGVD